MVEQEWLALPERFPNVDLDEFILMPNHLHGIVRLLPVDNQPTCGTSMSNVIGAFESITTRAYMEGVTESEWEPFDKRLWQRSFHDQVIRSLKHLENARDYVITNPANWTKDDLHPSHSMTPNQKTAPNASNIT